MAKKRILIVEDERIIADDIRASLIALDYEVPDIASSGEEAIKKAVEIRPDLVLMDIILKGNIDGIKAATHIRSNYNIPVVYLTSHSDEATFRRAKESGPFGYILKPFDERDLRTTIEMAIYNSQTEKVLKDSEKWLSITLRSIGDSIVVVDASNSIEFINPAAEALTGWILQEAAGRSMDEILTLIDEATSAILPNLASEVVRTGRALQYADNTVMVTRDGRRVFVDVNASPIRDKGNAISGVVAIFHDTTGRKEAERLIRKSERFMNTVFESIHDPFCILDLNYRVVRANKAYAEYRSLHMDDLLGNVCFEAIKGLSQPCEECAVEKTFKSKDPCVTEKISTDKEGGEVWLETYTYPVFDEKGAVTYVIEYTRDITERKRGEIERSRLIKELEYLSRTDRLTKLFNRGALIERLISEVERVKRYGSSLSLMLCDIDHFKSINDTHGHAEGDRALELISSILSDEVRSTDVVGRYGGDEFMIILPETELPRGREIAERIRKAVEGLEFSVSEDIQLHITLSIGLTMYTAEDGDFNPLIKRADDAMYMSKRGGRNRVSVMAS